MTGRDVEDNNKYNNNKFCSHEAQTDITFLLTFVKHLGKSATGCLIKDVGYFHL